MPNSKKIFAAASIAGVAGFASGFFICRKANKRRNKCIGALHIYKLTPNQEEAMYSEFYIPLEEVKRRKVIVLKVKKGV